MRSTAWRAVAVGAFASLISAGAVLAQQTPPASASAQRTILPAPEPAFKGHIEPSVPASTPDFLPIVRAPKGAPNVLLVMTDDVGFGASSAFGGPISTPNLEELAQHGLRYNEFHTTAICSPSRAALLTGRNHHAVGMGNLDYIQTGFPGYRGEITRSAVTIARILRDNGYATAMWGKHHDGRPDAHLFGPYDQWPTGLGFEYFFGFLGGDNDQWHPHLYRGTVSVDDQPPLGQTLDHLLVDDAINWVHNEQAAAPHRPFFMYLATGTSHAPHQAPPEWIAKYRGKFDQGWDQLRAQTFARQKAEGVIPASAALTPRPDAITAWSSLSDDQKRAFSHMMEVNAGALSYQDAQFGRLIAELKRMGQFDNTLVIFVEGDNGASAEAGNAGTLNELGSLWNGQKDTPAELVKAMPRMGGPTTYELYPVGWAWALNTPFQWVKQISSHFGGMRNGMVMSWPHRFDGHDQMRSQFSHLTDVAPTILEATGVSAPDVVDGVKQMPFDGASLLYTIDHPKEPTHHTTQYFEISGSRGIFHDGWFAGTTVRRTPWDTTAPTGDVMTSYHWELYDLAKDYSQAHDVAALYPDRLRQMEALWEAEAKRNNVFPIENMPFNLMPRPPRESPPQSKFTFWGANVMVSGEGVPYLSGGFDLSADVSLPNDHTNGVLVAVGSWFGGWSFYLHDGHVVCVGAMSNKPGDLFRIASADRIAAGHAIIRYTFTPDSPTIGSGGELKIFVDGKVVAEGRIDRTVPLAINIGETFDTGRDTGVPVTDEYQNQGRFEGVISRIDVSVGPRTGAAAAEKSDHD